MAKPDISSLRRLWRRGIADHAEIKAQCLERVETWRYTKLGTSREHPEPFWHERYQVSRGRLLSRPPRAEAWDEYGFDRAGDVVVCQRRYGDDLDEDFRRGLAARHGEAYHYVRGDLEEYFRLRLDGSRGEDYHYKQGCLLHVGRLTYDEDGRLVGYDTYGEGDDPGWSRELYTYRGGLLVRIDRASDLERYERMRARGEERPDADVTAHHELLSYNEAGELVRIVGHGARLTWVIYERRDALLPLPELERRVFSGLLENLVDVLQACNDVKRVALVYDAAGPPLLPPETFLATGRNEPDTDNPADWPDATIVSIDDHALRADCTLLSQEWQLAGDAEKVVSFLNDLARELADRLAGEGGSGLRIDPVDLNAENLV